MLDVPTLFLSALTAQTLLVLMLVVVFWGRFRDGLLEWSIAGALEVCGWLLFIAKSHVPGFMSAAVAVTLLSLCLSLSRISLKRFYGESVARWEIWLVPLVCLVQQTIWLEDGHSRIIFANLVLGGQALWCCWPLLKPRQDGTDRSRYLLVAGFSIFAISLFARSLLTAVAPQLMPDLRSPTPINVLSMWTTFMTVVLINVSLLMLHQDRAWFKNLRLALTDPLTGLLNRRALMEASAREIAVARRRSHGLIVMMMDLDFFKKINDTHGHPAGDVALKLFAACIREEARQSDLVARYGGEEFCVVLTGGRLADAEHLAERIRKRLEAKPLQTGEILRFSAGVSAWQAGEPDLDAAIQRSDTALYQAKETGRNRTVVA